MKILMIYDMHGRKEYIPSIEEIESVDMVVFGGDFLDSFDIHPAIQYNVLQQVIKIKKDYVDKVALLLGNHDCQYLHDRWVSKLKCSGFSQEYFLRFNILLKHHADMFQYAWQYINPDTLQKHIFTHAGITTHITNALNIRHPQAYEDMLDGHIELADLINGTQMEELYYIGKINGGHDPYSGIFWVRPSQLDKYKIEGYMQHIGHTHVGGIDKRYLDSKHLNYYDGLGKVTIKL